MQILRFAARLRRKARRMRLESIERRKRSEAELEEAIGELRFQLAILRYWWESWWR